ncbi:MAG: DinB family protein [Terriglobales bacterium]
MLPTPWFTQSFRFGAPLSTFPQVLERLRTTPARARALTAGWPDSKLSTRPDGKWSAKDHIGHLAALTPLDERRLDAYLRHEAVLDAADLTNRSTEEAGFATHPVNEILASLDACRQALIVRLELLTEAELAFTALHPRLRQPMRLLDWMEFVAKHDDHHLAMARWVIAHEPVNCR